MLPFIKETIVRCKYKRHKTDALEEYISKTGKRQRLWMGNGSL